jgi:drug/metabolite transporter (DMT)-like permease
VSFTAALVLTPRLAPGLDAPMRTFYMVGTCAAVLVLAAIATGRFALPVGAAAWIGLAGLSLLYAAGIAGLFLLLPLLGPVQTAVVLNLEPVVVAVVAWLVLGEALTAMQWVGALVVVVAVIAYQVRTLKV